MLEQITVLAIFHYFLIFCRVGAALMTLPGFGEIYVTPRSRLVLALVISFLMMPVIKPMLPPIPSGGLGLFLAITPEILIGLFIGGIGRMLQAILHIAGMIIAFQSSLAAAILFDATQGSQGSVIGNFMTIVGLTLLFAMDLHHVMLAGVAESYHVFEAAKFPITSDFAQLAAKTLSEGFLVALKISAPIIIVGLSAYLGAGIMSRLMPTMQVFFVMIPLQIYVGFIIVSFTLSAGMMWYLNHFKETMSLFFG